MSEITARLSTALADRYRIESRLGEGGMATVYLAEDPKHDRKVALKVLKPELAAVIGADRFIQEIKVTANLQHPNILALYDSGEARLPPLHDVERGTGGEAFLYYVMPYIEGESLRDKLNREKQLGVDESVSIAQSVAAALDYAHRHDVVHRDVKPENILLHDGQALVADFGIALAISAAAGKRLTETGLSVGTPHYMSPEQASADRELDGRSDIYSLAATLYEMLVGVPPFDAASAQAVVAKILTEEPNPVVRERASVPRHVDAVVRKALAKLPADRFATAADFAAALTNRGFVWESDEGTPTRETRPVRRLVVSIAVVVATLIGWWFGRSGDEGAARPPVRFTVPVPAGHDIGWQVRVAVSPDGRSIVYPTEGMLYQKRLDGFAGEALPGTEGANVPTYSPDGASIAFVQGSRIRKMPSAGGPVTDVASVRVTQGAVLGLSWGDDDQIAFTRGVGHEGIWRVSAFGGEPERLTTVLDSAQETVHAWPQLLPGADRVLFTVVGPSGGWEDGSIVLKDVTTGTRQTILQHGTHGIWIASGYLLFVDAHGTVMGAAFDPDHPADIGQAQPLASGVRIDWWGGSAAFGVSSGGTTAAFFRGTGWADHRVWIVDRTGSLVQELGPALTANSLSLSPDDRYVAMTRRSANNDDIVTFEVATGNSERLSFDIAEDESPVWSPDGTRIAYSSAATGKARRFYLKDLDGGNPRQVYTHPKHAHISSWSPDGKWLLFDEVDFANQTDVLALNLDDTTEVVTIASSAALEYHAVFDPDGAWIAYAEADQTTSQVHIVSFPDLDTRRQISTTGGAAPHWSRTGDLFFLNGTTMMVARKRAGVPSGWDTPVALFEAPRLWTQFPDYEVTSDGERFVLQIVNPDAPTREMYVITDWAAELQRILGT